MHLPTFPRAMPVTRRVQTDFRGYDHRPGCPEGGIYEMTNGSAGHAPPFFPPPQGRLPPDFVRSTHAQTDAGKKFPVCRFRVGFNWTC